MLSKKEESTRRLTVSILWRLTLTKVTFCEFCEFWPLFESLPREKWKVLSMAKPCEN